MSTPNFYNQFLSSMPPTKQIDGEKKFYRRFDQQWKLFPTPGWWVITAGSYGKRAVKISPWVWIPNILVPIFWFVSVCLFRLKDVFGTTLFTFFQLYSTNFTMDPYLRHAHRHENLRGSDFGTMPLGLGYGEGDWPILVLIVEWQRLLD